MFKRTILILVFLFVLAIPAFAAETVVEISDPSGEYTMMELKEYWMENGFPDVVGYMERQGYLRDGATEAEAFWPAERLELCSLGYRQIADVEVWHIGVMGDFTELEALLRSSIRNDCIVYFIPAGSELTNMRCIPPVTSMNKLLALYPQVVEDFAGSIGCGQIVMRQGQIHVFVDPLLGYFRSKHVEETYGDAVMLHTTEDYHWAVYDENGNTVNVGEPPITLFVFVVFSIGVLVLILLVFGIWGAVFGIRKVWKRIRSRQTKGA